MHSPRATISGELPDMLESHLIRSGTDLEALYPSERRIAAQISGEFQLFVKGPLGLKTPCGGL
jgi:hypothetical protein